MAEKKPVLPLKWIIAGFAFLIAYLVAGWQVVMSLYASHGLLAAIGAVVALSAFSKFLLSPLVIRFLRSRKPLGVQSDAE